MATKTPRGPIGGISSARLRKQCGEFSWNTLRSKKAQKRGGQHHCVEFNEQFQSIEFPAGNLDDLLDLHESLDRLAHDHPDKAELVKLLYFAGLNLDEAAAARGISRTTAYRHWQFARAWLYDAVAGKRSQS